MNVYFADQSIMQMKELNFEVLEIQKWNILTDRTQRTYEKKWVICLFIMFTPRVLSFKCQKWLIFCIFCWEQQKISHSLKKVLKCIWKILFSSFRKCHQLLVSELPLARCRPFKIQDFNIFCWLSSFLVFLPNNISQLVTPKPI